MFDNIFSKKEKPIPGILGLGGGGTGLSFGGGVAGASAEGGNEIIDTGTHWLHVFTSPGNFINPGSLVVDYVMVGGGGFGGGNLTGGGGGGAFIYKTSVTLPASTYPIGIGPGGPSTVAPGSWVKPNNGTPTTFNSLTAAGGGGSGGPYPGPPTYQSGSPGASGGGGNGEWSSWPGGSATVDPYPGVFGDSPNNGYGHPGGWGTGGWNFCGGGAGGAAAAGVNGNIYDGGAGGDGLPVPWMPPSYGTPGPQPGRYFAGGGGGEEGATGPPGPSTAGKPGWGAGTPGSLPAGGDNTGGGGGGTHTDGTGSARHNGSDGIVAIRYPK